MPTKIISKIRRLVVKIAEGLENDRPLQNKIVRDILFDEKNKHILIDSIDKSMEYKSFNEPIIISIGDKNYKIVHTVHSYSASKPVNIQYKGISSQVTSKTFKSKTKPSVFSEYASEPSVEYKGISKPSIANKGRSKSSTFKPTSNHNK